MNMLEIYVDLLTFTRMIYHGTWFFQHGENLRKAMKHGSKNGGNQQQTLDLFF